MSPPVAPPPPGWYRDPAGAPATLRWWDGVRWARHTRPRSPEPPSDPQRARAATYPASPTTTPGPPTPAPDPPTPAPDPPPSAWPPAPPAPTAPPAWPAAPPAWPTAPPGAATSPAGWPPPATGRLLPPGQGSVIPLRGVWWAVLGFLAGEVLGGLLTVLVALVAGVSASRLNSSASVLLAGEVGLWGGMLGACLLVSRRYGTGSLRTDYGLGVRLSDLGFGLLAAVSALVAELIVAAAFAHTRFQGTNTQIITGERHSGVGFAVVTVIVAVGAPFFEELFFRGLLRTALKARLPPALAVLCQAVLFGLAHIQSGFGTGNLSIVVTITCVGLILGLVAERTGRLGAGMIGHGLFNLTATLLILA